MRQPWIWAGLVAGLACLLPPAFGDDDVATSAFAAVEPILRRCASCHQGDEAPQALRMINRQDALAGGETGPAIVPGDAGSSLAWRMVDRRKMPPRAPLSPEESAVFRRWIDLGAPWVGNVQPLTNPEDDRWAWRPLVRPPLPPSSTEDTHPIDRFLNARMAAESITPEPSASRASLIRRLAFDLCGLPPSPDEVEQFVADETPGAYDRLVDRLLSSPSYGERWARHWLDVARFAESDGFEYDHIREAAWPYRDYVIDSLNADIPYARFVREQIAGDVLPDADPATIAATGFLVAGPWDEANKIQANKIMQARTREEELDEMIAAVGQTFLGVTVNCARCHDHKFDPIPQEDYYRFSSALAGVQHGDRPAISPSALKDRERRRAEWIAAKQEADVAIAAIVAKASRRLVGEVDNMNTPSTLPIARWSFETDETDDHGGLPSRLEGDARVENGRLRLSGKGAYLVAGPFSQEIRAKTLEGWVRLEDREQGGGALVSIQGSEGGIFDAVVYGEREPGKWVAGSDGFRRTRDLVASREESPTDELIHMVITYAEDGTISVYRNGRPYAEAYRPPPPVTTFGAGKSWVLIGLRHYGAGNGFLAGEVEEVRVYDRALSTEEVAASHREGPAGRGLAEILAAMTPEERRARDVAVTRRDEILKSIAAIATPPMVYAARPTQVEPTHVLARGDVEKPGKVVSAGGLSALEAVNAEWNLAPDAPESSRRLAMADWITHRDNPLFWRVMANRVWHYHFGTGLVASPNDFGVNGERPSHPDLLDWLACELRDSGGRLKAFHRLIVASDAYRRSSRFNPASAEKDADTRLLWRYPPRRLEGEAIRDAMLAASGELNPAMGGPSFRPFSVTVFGSNLYSLTDPVGPEFNRRTIYRIHVLSAKSPLLDALDCPDPATKMPRRGQTTTPLQALALMNDSFVNRQAEKLAERALRDAENDTARAIERMYRLTLGRSPSPEEANRAKDLAQNHGMADVAWMLFNATEFVYVD